MSTSKIMVIIFAILSVAMLAVAVVYFLKYRKEVAKTKLMNVSSTAPAVVTASDATTVQTSSTNPQATA